MAATENQDGAKTLRAPQINKALGLFLLIFASVLLVAILFTETMIGRVTNLAAAVVIGGIGGAMFLSGLRADRRQPPS